MKQRKILSAIMALIMVLTLLPVTAWAIEPTEVDTQEELFAALQSGGNIRVTGGISVTSKETLEITKPVILDLNGKTVSWESSAKEIIKICNGGDLTIQDASNTGALNFTSTYTRSSNYGVCVFTDGSLTFTGGTISYHHDSKSGGAIYTNSNAELTMTGGTVKISGASNYAMYLASSGLHRITGGTIAFDKNASASTLYGVYAMTFSDDPAGFQLSGLTVDGSVVPDAKTVICVRGYNSSTPVTISGGTYTANGKSASYAVGAGSSNKTSISGGTFNGAVKAAVKKITGGQFSVQPSANYLALGKVSELQADGYYHVVDGSYVARIGDKGYLTWDELFADVSSTASSVYLLSDAAEITVPEGKNVTFYNSSKFSVGKLINNGTCKIITYALAGTEVVNNGMLSLDHEVGSLVNNTSGVVNATANSPKVTGAITNHGTMTISKGTYAGSITNDGTLTITGGTFARDVKDLCAQGYTTQQNKEGTWDVMADVPHVAEIDGYWYGSLSAAMNAAQSGDTVKLLSDTTLNSAIKVSNKTLTLDMNGRKITYGASGNNYGMMTFMGASNITITGNGSFNFDETYSAESSKAGGRIFDVENSTVLTIENGAFHAGLTCVLVDNNAKAIILGGSYSASQAYLDSGNWFLLNLQDNTGAQIVVYGGTFAQYNPAKSYTEPGGPVSFCAEGYTATSEVKENVTYYTVGPDSTQAFAAEIGGLKYVSLDKALEAAKDGDTVTLLSKYEGEPVTIAKAITIDLGDTGTTADQFFAGEGYQVETGERTLTFVRTYTITFHTNNGSAVAPVTVKDGGTVAKPDDPTRDGYTFGGWYSDAELTVAYDFTAAVTSDITLYAKWTQNAPDGGGSSSGGSGSSGNKTETTTNPDGSTTTTVTKPDGSTTETTKNPDGSTEVVNTDKTGNVTTTTTDKTGNKTETVEKTDGTSQTTVTNKDGSSSTTTVDETGKTEAQVKLPDSLVNDAADKGEAVALPMPQVSATTDTETAPAVTVTLPGSSTSAKVEIPVADVTPGTVAVIVKADGTEEIIKTSLTTENGVAVTLSDGDTVKIVDNTKDFVDVSDSYWGSDEIAFAASRELFNGTSATTFSPETDMNRAMIITVLARYEGVDTTGGDTWYDQAVTWAVENGVSDGTNLMDSITREQLATMLYRYAGEPAVTGSLNAFTDGASVSDYAADAMVWAVELGLIGGMGDGRVAPQGTATRAQVAAILARFVAAMN